MAELFVCTPGILVGGGCFVTIGAMSEEEDKGRTASEEVWDEYRWEAYIRQQEGQAEQYLALLEYYADESDAHNLIARSMGWEHLLTNCSGEPDPGRCSECPPSRQGPCRFYECYFGRRQRLRREAHGPLPWEVDGEEEEKDSQETVHGAQYVQWQIVYGQHAIQSEATALIGTLGEICGHLPGGYPKISSPLCRLLHHAHRCVGKIAGALNQYVEPSQRGLIVAHLKTAFQAACLSLGQISLCQAHGDLSQAAAEELTGQLLKIRQQVLELIDDFRAQLTRLMGDKA